MNIAKTDIDIDKLLRSRHIKPQHEWGWQVVVDLFLAGTGAGSLAFAMLMGWLGYINDDILRAMTTWGFAMVAAGAGFLVLKLGVKKRFLNTVLNPMSSWLSRGFYILAGCMISGGILWIASMYTALELDVLTGFDIAPFAPVITVFEIICFIFGLGSAIYTGILILSVKYVPLWYTPLLPILFTISALASGSMVVILSTQIYDLVFQQFGFSDVLLDILIYTNLVFVVLEGITLVVYLRSRYKAAEFSMYSVLLILSGNLKNKFWIGMVVIGFVIPLILELVFFALPDVYPLLLAAGVLMLIGRFFLRWVLVYSGLKEQPPMLRMVDARRRINRGEEVMSVSGK